MKKEVKQIIEKIEQGFEVDVEFSEETWKIIEIRKVSDDYFFIMEKNKKQLMVNCKNKDFKYNNENETTFFEW